MAGVRKPLPTGERFGKWVVIGEGDPVRLSGVLHRRARVRCDCGRDGLVQLGTLRSGTSKSCGCMKRNPGTHLGTGTRLYHVWCGIRARCLRPTDDAWDRYGGRGISIAPEWRTNFVAFRDWITNALGPMPANMTVDRINNDGNYEPGNLRFALWVTQANNRSNTVRLTHPVTGETKAAADWARYLGVKYCTFKARWRRGVPLLALLTHR